MTWFAWHNGTADAGNRDIAPYLSPMCLEMCVEYLGEMRNSWDLYDLTGSWIPFLKAGGNLVVMECPADTGAPSRIGFIEIQQPGPIALAPDLLTVVGWWIEMYEAGHYRLVDGFLDYDPAVKYPDDRVATGLILGDKFQHPLDLPED